jgi:urease accessory protein
MISEVAKTRQASLELTFSSRQGRTIISSQYANSPLKIWRPFDLDDERALVQIVNVSPGMMAGDDYRLEITIKAGAKVVLVNQSATKLHSMPEGQFGKQTILITVEDNAELEYYPGLTIPFPGSDFRQSIDVSLTQTARFALLERWSTGRIARGEVHQYRKVSARVRITRNSKLIYADGLELQEGVGLLDGYLYTVSGVWCWGESFRAENMQTETMMLVSGRAANQVAYLRALAKDGLELKTSLDKFVKCWRKEQGIAEVVFSRFTS